MPKLNPASPINHIQPIRDVAGFKGDFSRQFADRPNNVGKPYAQPIKPMSGITPIGNRKQQSVTAQDGLINRNAPNSTLGVNVFPNLSKMSSILEHRDKVEEVTTYVDYFKKLGSGTIVANNNIIGLFNSLNKIAGKGQPANIFSQTSPLKLEVSQPKTYEGNQGIAQAKAYSGDFVTPMAEPKLKPKISPDLLGVAKTAPFTHGNLTEVDAKAKPGPVDEVDLLYREPSNLKFLRPEEDRLYNSNIHRNLQSTLGGSNNVGTMQNEYDSANKAVNLLNGIRSAFTDKPVKDISLASLYDDNVNSRYNDNLNTFIKMHGLPENSRAALQYRLTKDVADYSSLNPSDTSYANFKRFADPKREFWNVGGLMRQSPLSMGNYGYKQDYLVTDPNKSEHPFNHGQYAGRLLNGVSADHKFNAPRYYSPAEDRAYNKRVLEGPENPLVDELGSRSIVEKAVSLPVQAGGLGMAMLPFLRRAWVNRAVGPITVRQVVNNPAASAPRLPKPPVTPVGNAHLGNVPLVKTPSAPATTPSTPVSKPVPPPLPVTPPPLPVTPPPLPTVKTWRDWPFVRLFKGDWGKGDIGGYFERSLTPGLDFLSKVWRASPGVPYGQGPGQRFLSGLINKAISPTATGIAPGIGRAALFSLPPAAIAGLGSVGLHSLNPTIDIDNNALTKIKGLGQYVFPAFRGGAAEWLDRGIRDVAKGRGFNYLDYLYQGLSAPVYRDTYPALAEATERTLGKQWTKGTAGLLANTLYSLQPEHFTKADKTTFDKSDDINANNWWLKARLTPLQVKHNAESLEGMQAILDTMDPKIRDNLGPDRLRVLADLAGTLSGAGAEDPKTTGVYSHFIGNDGNFDNAFVDRLVNSEEFKKLMGDNSEIAGKLDVQGDMLDKLHRLAIDIKRGNTGNSLNSGSQGTSAAPSPAAPPQASNTNPWQDLEEAFKHDPFKSVREGFQQGTNLGGKPVNTLSPNKGNTQYDLGTGGGSLDTPSNTTPQDKTPGVVKQTPDLSRAPAAPVTQEDIAASLARANSPQPSNKTDTISTLLGMPGRITQGIRDLSSYIPSGDNSTGAINKKNDSQPTVPDQGGEGVGGSDIPSSTAAPVKGTAQYYKNLLDASLVNTPDIQSAVYAAVDKGLDKIKALKIESPDQLKLHLFDVLKNDPALAQAKITPQQLADALNVTPGLFDRMTDLQKIMLMGGLGISLVSMLTGSNDDDEEDNSSMFSKALPYLGAGGIAYGLSGGNLANLIDINHYNPYTTIKKSAYIPNKPDNKSKSKSWLNPYTGAAVGVPVGALLSYALRQYLSNKN